MAESSRLREVSEVRFDPQMQSYIIHNGNNSARDDHVSIAPPRAVTSCRVATAIAT